MTPANAAVQTTEKEYMAALDPYAQPPSVDPFSYTGGTPYKSVSVAMDKPNGKHNQDLSEKIEAAKQLISATVPVISGD